MRSGVIAAAVLLSLFAGCKQRSETPDISPSIPGSNSCADAAGVLEAAADSVPVVTNTFYALEPSLNIADSFAGKLNKLLPKNALKCVFCSRYMPDNSLWVGTEGDGLYVVKPGDDGKLALRRFSRKDGLGDDFIYAILRDRRGRIWVGHLNHGVSVYTGSEWRNYDAVTGPVGERVFALAENPLNGEVWMATSAGLACYNDSTGKWAYLTRANGLPSDQITCLAFAADGTIFAGTDCAGLAIGRLRDGRRHWQTVTAPLKARFEPVGEGIPSDQCNALLVATNGTVYLGTSGGLGISGDNGVTWRYLRGNNFANKMRELYRPKGSKIDSLAQTGIKLFAKCDSMRKLPSEDYITSLAETADGSPLIGFRYWEPMLYDTESRTMQRLVDAVSGKKRNAIYLNQMLPCGNLMLATGFCDKFITLKNPAQTNALTLAYTICTNTVAAAEAPTATTVATPELPAAAQPPSAQTLMRLAKGLPEIFEKSPPVKKATYLWDDWVTQGDWFGRHGQFYAMLCAMCSPHNQIHDIFPRPATMEYEGAIGPHYKNKDSKRNWLHWVKSDQRRVLYLPARGFRREAEWDDHGEAYSANWDGPDIWIPFEIKTNGLYRLSLYFINPNGHNPKEKMRDYIVEIKDYTNDLQKAHFAPVIAKTRVHHFWGGVYKCFAIRGHRKYYIHISRNYSFNTMISGIMLQPIITPNGVVQPITWMGDVRYPQKINNPAPPDSAACAAAAELWEVINQYAGNSRSIELDLRLRIAAYRTICAAGGDQTDIARLWRRQIPLWIQSDRKEFDHYTRKGFEWLVSRNPKIFDKNGNRKHFDTPAAMWAN